MEPVAVVKVAASPGERRKERLAIASLALAAFALNLNTNVLGPLLPFFTGDLAELQAGKDWLLVAAAWGSAFGALSAGVWADRAGRRTPLLAGLSVFVVASALHLWAAGYWQVLLLRAVSGFAVGVAYTPASTLVAELVPYERRGAAMGAFTAGMFLAIPLGLPLAVELADHWHWSGIFAVQAAIGLAGLLLAWRVVPAHTGEGSWVAPWPLLRHPGVKPALLAVMLHVGSFVTVTQLASIWLDGAGILEKGRHGLLWVSFGALSAIGSFALGGLADRIGKRVFVMIGSLVLAAGFVLLAQASSMWALLGLGAVLATVAAARTGPLQALTSALVEPRELGTLMGLRAFAMQCGVALCVKSGSSLFDGFAGATAVADGFGAVLLLAAACQLGSFLAVRYGIRRLR